MDLDWCGSLKANVFHSILPVVQTNLTADWESDFSFKKERNCCQIEMEQDSEPVKERWMGVSRLRWSRSCPL